MYGTERNDVGVLDRSLEDRADTMLTDVMGSEEGKMYSALLLFSDRKKSDSPLQKHEAGIQMNV